MQKCAGTLGIGRKIVWTRSGNFTGFATWQAGLLFPQKRKMLVGAVPKPCESGQGAGAARLILKRYNPFHGHFLDGLTRKKEKSAAGPEDIASRTAALMVYGFVILFRQRRDRLLK